MTSVWLNLDEQWNDIVCFDFVCFLDESGSCLLLVSTYQRRSFIFVCGRPYLGLTKGPFKDYAVKNDRFQYILNPQSGSVGSVFSVHQGDQLKRHLGFNIMPLELDMSSTESMVLNINVLGLFMVMVMVRPIFYLVLPYF